MFPSVTRELKSSIINYLTSGVISFLIYMPSLGMENPSQEEYERRLNLTMDQAVEYEIGGLSLNGYQRCQAFINVEQKDSITVISYDVSFSSYEASMGPFTHVCLARGSVFNEDPATGNGRGDSIGTLIYASPCSSSPLTLDKNENYKATLYLNLTNYLV